MMTEQKLVTTCSSSVKSTIAALVISLIVVATTALPLPFSNSASVTNQVSMSTFSSRTHFVPYTSPRKRVGHLLFSSSCSSSSHVEPPVEHRNRENSNSITVDPVEAYTNHWDNLLLEEHRLALDEWRDRQNNCSLRVLEDRGLAISRAFALPDSEVLGEKIVRIHDGSGSGSKKNNINRILEGGIVGDESDDLNERDSRNKNKRNGGRHFRRPWNEIFSKGDILEMTASGDQGGFSSQSFRRECLVMDVGDSWMLVGVGKTWPLGVWDARKGFSGNNKMKRGLARDIPSYGYPIRLDKTPNAAALTPLRAQRSALQTIREQPQKENSSPVIVATWFTKTTKEHCKGYYQLRNKRRWANNTPRRFREIISSRNGTSENNREEEELSLGTHLRDAIERVTKRRSLLSKSSSNLKNWSATANESQREAIVWALSRRVSSIQGPPGTGKTRVAALLIATALEMAKVSNACASGRSNSVEHDADKNRPFRVLAVAHSNGAADVLLEALLELGVPAVRAGRPAAISAAVRHRSVIALAERIPQVVRLRKELLEATQNNGDMNKNNNIEWELHQCLEDAQNALLDSAPVVVTSCIGAHQLSIRQDELREEEIRRRQQKQVENDEDLGGDNDDIRFPLVVLDEAAQCTEPALVCALVAARAEQLVMVGDTKQLPPTVASSSKTLRESLGISPMERLEKSGLVEQTVLRTQYRMVQALLDHPSKYFYDGLVKSAGELPAPTKVTKDQNSILEVFTPREEGPRQVVAPTPAGFVWPNPLLPLAFVSVGGADAEVLHDSTMGLAGRSNPTEAKLATQIVADILEKGELTASQICVLTPYSKQVTVIRSTLGQESLLRRHRYQNSHPKNLKDRSICDSNAVLTSSKAMDTIRSISDVRVGTIDSFQGQETEVVIFSAVRSNSMSELGFLRDPRRLCVALTRARRGLVILGDSKVLKSCRHWRSLIESCENRNCFITVDNLSSNQFERDDGSVHSERQEVDKDNAKTEIKTFSDDGNETNREVSDRKELSLLKPEEEFLGLFSTPE